MPATDLALLTQAAHAAGEIALRYWRKSPEVWEKGAGEGPVTEADLAVNAMLQAELCAARPDYGWFSEETPDSADRLNSERVFIIDPIDGTRAFVEGNPDFAHSLCIAQNGRVTAAAVFLPAQEKLYAASDSTIATLNDKPIHCTSKTTATEATLLTARPNLAPEHWHDDTPPSVRRMFRSSLAWRMCLVAEGAFDAMLTLRPTWEWDVAAGSLIVEKAGGMVRDRMGAAPIFNSAKGQMNGCLAAPQGLLHDLLGKLR